MRRNRFIRYRLVHLFLVTTIVAGCLAFYVNVERRIQREINAANEITLNGGKIVRKDVGPPWMLQRYRTRVSEVEFYDPYPKAGKSTTLADFKQSQQMTKGKCLDLLSSFQELDILDLTGTALRVEDLSQLRTASRIKELRWWDPEGNFSALAECRSLRAISIHGEQVSYATLQALCAHSNLQAIDLSDSMIGDSDLAFLKSASSLRSLDLSKTLVDGKGLKCLSECRALETLEIAQHPSNEREAYAELSLLLTTLPPWPSGRISLVSLPRLEELRSVDLENATLDAESLASLATQPALASLNLNRAGIDEKWLKDLTKLKLVWLSLVEVPIGHDGLAAIGEMPTLEWLSISAAPGIDDDDLLPVLLRLKKLKYIAIEPCCLSDDSIRQLFTLPKLEQLILGQQLHLRGSNGREGKRGRESF